MASDPYVQIRQRFDDILADVEKQALEQHCWNQEQTTHLPLSPEIKYSNLYKSKQKVINDIVSLEHKEYYHLAQYPHLVGILYFSRLICLGRDEEKPVREAMSFYKSEKYIDYQLTNTIDELHPHSFEDYLAANNQGGVPEGQEVPLFTSEKDAERICEWKREKKISCIQLEFGKLKANYQKVVKDDIDPNENVLAEITLVEEILINALVWKTPQLIAELKKVKGMSGILMPEDPKEFHRQVVSFLQGNNLDEKLSPLYFQKIITAIESSRVSPMPVFWLSLLMYCRWLYHLVTFNTDVFDNEESSYDRLFENTYNEVINNPELWLHRFKSINLGKPLNRIRYEKILLGEMEKQRKLFNNMHFPHYFDLLGEKEKLKNSFINDCLKSFNTELPREALRHAIISNESIGWLQEKLSLLKHNPITPVAKQIKDQPLLLEILCHMAPNTRIINCFLDCMQLIKEQISNDRIPMLFINKNANYLFGRVLKEAKENLKKALERMDLVDRGCFIANMVREINHLLSANKPKCKKSSLFIKQLKQMLKNESKSAKKIFSYHSEQSIEKAKEGTKTAHKKISFGYQAGPGPLKPILKAMVLKMNIFADLAMVDDFIEALMCPDLSKYTKKIQLGFKLNNFARFIEKVKPWCKSFTPARIEQSGIFISLKEGPVIARVIYNSKDISQEDSDLMEKIFNAKYPTKD